MKEILHKIISKIKFIYSYFKSLIFGLLLNKRYNKIQTFVMFIGYPRSGHSLIASLLDAHPNIIIGMEWGVMSHMRMGYNQDQIFYSILNNSKAFNKRMKNVWTGYSYHVDNMWQGRFSELQVIGDKLGGRTSMMIRETPGLLEQLEDIIDKPLKFIHVIRNPYDVITTMTKRSFERKGEKGALKTIHLLPFIKSYFDRVETISWFKRNSQVEMFDLYQEDFIKDPDKVLRDLLNFINVDIVDNYLQTCSKIVYKQPNKSRFDIEWTNELVNFVQDEINKYSFLDKYSYKT